jgi:hypothetical protein
MREEGHLAPLTGTLYLTEKYICFAAVGLSQRKIIVPFKDVTALSKDNVLGLLSNAIKIVTDGSTVRYVLYVVSISYYNVAHLLIIIFSVLFYDSETRYSVRIN